MNLIVLFGATGDLSKRKIFKALYNLYKQGELDNTKILGISRRDYKKEDFIDYLKKNIFEDEIFFINEFFLKIDYLAGDFKEENLYTNLKDYASKFEQIFFFLAVQQKHYLDILNSIGEFKLNGSNSKLVLEKPLGTTLNELVYLTDQILKVFSEDNVYLIDHYLHKKIVQNIFGFRFFNNMFESSWNNKYIEKIEINMLEDLGLEDRGAFYESLGALRDVGQNHLLQIVALLIMRAPVKFDEKGFREAKTEAISSIKLIDEKQIASSSFRAQYRGYKDIKGVNPNSNVDTFFRLRLESDLPNFVGVPIILQAGKKLSKEDKNIVVTFKDSHKSNYSSFGISDSKSEVTFRLMPNEELVVNLDLAIGGIGGNLKADKIQPHNNSRYINEYVSIFKDLFSGKNLWFVGFSEIFASWKLIDSVLELWNKNLVPLNFYNPLSDDVILKAKDNVAIHYNKSSDRNIGVIGLGKMGGGISRLLVDRYWNVIGFNRSFEKVDDFVSYGGEGVYNINELVKKLPRPRKIIVAIPEGDELDKLFFNKGLIDKLDEGDYIIDVGNSNFKKTIERFHLFEKKGVRFVDVGVSGGPYGARNGACLMVGGKKEYFEYLEDIFKDMSLSGGYKFFEGVGAGHFVKMIHNGIEYGIMQSIAEGFTLLHKSDFNLNLKEVAEIYNNGSVIESRLIGWLNNAFTKYGINLDSISSFVESSGEGKWTVDFANQINLSVKIIEESLKFRLESKNNSSYTGKVLSALRGEFGGHKSLKSDFDK